MEKETKEQLEVITSGLASIVAKENIQFVEKSKYDELKAKIDKAIEILGKYKHYYLPEPEQNSANEDIVMKVLSILQGEEVK